MPRKAFYWRNKWVDFTLKLALLTIALGAHVQRSPHESSRDPLYLCCRTPAAKDAAPPRAIRDVLFL